MASNKCSDDRADCPAAELMEDALLLESTVVSVAPETLAAADSNHASRASKKSTCNLDSIAACICSKFADSCWRSRSIEFNRRKAVTISKHCGMVTCPLRRCNKCLRKSDWRLRICDTTRPTTTAAFFSLGSSGATPWRRSNVLAKAATLNASSYKLDRTHASISDGSSNNSKRDECCNRVLRRTRCLSDMAANVWEDPCLGLVELPSRSAPPPPIVLLLSPASSSGSNACFAVTMFGSDFLIVSCNSANASCKAAPRRSTPTKTPAFDAHNDRSCSSAASNAAFAIRRSSN
mmetsp:Transcript_26220/g.40219  ORF Transcript_26220/g.40219 Transcript_26220/m.40219 type:complete len:292 (-) Transcript_26220:132-1007(-)